MFKRKKKGNFPKGFSIPDLESAHLSELPERNLPMEVLLTNLALVLDNNGNIVFGIKRANQYPVVLKDSPVLNSNAITTFMQYQENLLEGKNNFGVPIRTIEITGSIQEHDHAVPKFFKYATVNIKRFDVPALENLPEVQGSIGKLWAKMTRKKKVQTSEEGWEDFKGMPKHTRKFFLRLRQYIYMMTLLAKEPVVMAESIGNAPKPKKGKTTVTPDNKSKTTEEVFQTEATGVKKIDKTVAKVNKEAKVQE